MPWLAPWSTEREQRGEEESLLEGAVKGGAGTRMQSCNISLARLLVVTRVAHGEWARPNLAHTGGSLQCRSPTWAVSIGDLGAIEGARV